MVTATTEDKKQTFDQSLWLVQSHAVMKWGFGSFGSIEDEAWPAKRQAW